MLIEEDNVLFTRCGTPCGRRLQSWGQLERQPSCPNCGGLLDEESVQHDRYQGSSHAHEGWGSLGLAAHHHVVVCPDCYSCDCEVCTHVHSAECYEGWEASDVCPECGEADSYTVTDTTDVPCPVTGETVAIIEERTCSACGCDDWGALTEVTL